MKRTFFLGLLVLFSAALKSQAFEIKVGEKLTYELEIYFWDAGTLTLEVKDNNDSTLTILGEVELKEYPSLLKPFSLPRPAPFFGSKISRRDYLTRISYFQNHHWRKEEMFDQERGVVINPEKIEIAIPYGTCDLLTTLFKVRNLKVKDREIIRSHFRGKNYEIVPNVKEDGKQKTFLGKVETIKVDSGWLSPQDFRFQVWLSNDEERIPLKLEGEFLIKGHIRLPVVATLKTLEVP